MKTKSPYQEAPGIIRIFPSLLSLLISGSKGPWRETTPDLIIGSSSLVTRVHLGSLVLMCTAPGRVTVCNGQPLEYKKS